MDEPTRHQVDQRRQQIEQRFVSAENRLAQNIADALEHFLVLMPCEHRLIQPVDHGLERLCDHERTGVSIVVVECENLEARGERT